MGEPAALVRKPRGAARLPREVCGCLMHFGPPTAAAGSTRSGRHWARCCWDRRCWDGWRRDGETGALRASAPVVAPVRMGSRLAARMHARRDDGGRAVIPGRICVIACPPDAPRCECRDRSERIGTTSRQMLEAPPGAFYLWPVGRSLDYARHLARHLRRDDLRIIGPDNMEMLRGIHGALVVDHACGLHLTSRQWEDIERWKGKR